MSAVLLASAHHLLAFLLVATLATELTLCRPGIDTKTLATLGRVDLGYGVLSGLLLAAGMLRLFYGEKGWTFYAVSPFFWAKMAALGAAGVMSLPPTLAILGWNRARRRGGAAPADVAIRRAHRWMHGEAAVLLLVPVFAAAMARGLGL